MYVLASAASAAVQEPAIDPTLLAVLSIFGGVAVTAGAGLLGAWIQGRREHTRWLRERRLDAYLRFIPHVHELEAWRGVHDRRALEIEAMVIEKAALDERLATATVSDSRIAIVGEMTDLTRRMTEMEAVQEKSTAQFQDIVDRAVDAASPAGLLGSSLVRSAAYATIDRQASADERIRRIGHLQSLMRASLNIKD